MKLRPCLQLGGEPVGSVELLTKPRYCSPAILSREKKIYIHVNTEKTTKKT